MARDASGNYTAPVGTTAVPGNLITDTEFNNFVADIGNEMTGSARESEMRDLGGTQTTTTASGGTAGVNYALTLNTPWTSLGNGLAFSFRAHTANTGPCTITINSVQTGSSVAFPLRAISGVDLSAGDLSAGAIFTGALNLTSFSSTFTGNLTNSSNQVTSVSSTAGLLVGQALTSTTAGIPPGTTISAITGSTITLSAPFAGTTTVNATCNVTGAEVLLMNGALAATGSRLALAGGVSMLSLSASTTLGSIHKSKLVLVTGSPTLTFDRPSTLGAGWFAYLRNDGTGDVALSVKSAGSFTSTVTNGSASITNVSNTTGLAVGQVLNGPNTVTNFTGSLNNGSATLGGLSSATGLAVGALIYGGSPYLPAGTTVSSLTASVTYTNVTMSVSTNTITFTGSAATIAQLGIGAPITSGQAGFPPSATILAYSLSGSTVTVLLSGNYTGANTSSASVTLPQGYATLSSIYTGPSVGGGSIGSPYQQTFGLQAIVGLLPGTTISAISGTTLTASNSWTAATNAAASFTTTADTIDGLQGYTMYPGETRLFTCDGTTFRSAILEPGTRKFPSSGLFVVPPGITALWLRATGGGGGGGGGNTNGGTGAGGGGGGACVERLLTPMPTPGSTVFLTVGAGGAGGAGFAGTASYNPGSQGGNTSFGAYLVAYGGGGGGGTVSGGIQGAGTGAGSAGPGTSGGNGGSPNTSAATVNAVSGGGAGISASNPGGNAEWGGAGGGYGGVNTGQNGGGSLYGGAGGGGAGSNSASTAGAGGPGGAGGVYSNGGGGAGGSAAGANGAAGADSVTGYGGNGGGGAGTPATSPTTGFSGGAGGSPGGGGGGGGTGSTIGGNGGNGGRGEIRIWWN